MEATGNDAGGFSVLTLVFLFLTFLCQDLHKVICFLLSISVSVRVRCRL